LVFAKEVGQRGRESASADTDARRRESKNVGRLSFVGGGGGGVGGGRGW
jgi:hypothetical protein